MLDGGSVPPTVVAMSGLHLVGHSTQILTVEVDGRSFDLHAMWLRDACVCEHCRNPSSHERLLDSAAISPEIEIITAVNEPVAWLQVVASDGHRIWIPAAWLAEHLETSDLRHDPARGRQLWDATTIGVGCVFDIYWFDQPEERGPWLDLMYEQGVTWLGKHLFGEQGLRDVAALIGPIRPTNYGEIWTVDATVEPVTAVDSEGALRAHTDLPYFDNPPGVQLMQVESEGVDGGDTTLVDGYAVAEYLRATDPDAWRLLTTIDFSYPFVRSDVEMHGRAPLISLAPDGTYAQVRRAPDLVGTPYVDAADAPALYRAVRTWTDLIDGEHFERRVGRDSSRILAWDNHRLLHGRTAFRLGSHGRRVLRGCYVDIDHLRSERALTARRAGPA